MEISELVRKAQNGDSEAYGEIYDQFAQRLFRYIKTKIQEPKQAEDILQEVFLKAWVGLPKLKLEELNFSAWLFRVASNTINDHFRKIYREPNISELDEKAINVPSSDSPQKNLIRKDDKTQLQSAFSKLPENYREILELRFIQEFNLKETCEILGRNSVSVRVLQYRALSKLKNILNSEYGFSGEKIQ